MAALRFQETHVVRLSDEERTTGIMTEEHVGEAVSAVHRDGLVVLENAVDPAHCDELNSILVDEAEIMAKLPTTHFNDVGFPSVTQPSHASTVSPAQQLRGTCGKNRTPSTAARRATCPRARRSRRT